VITNAGGSRYGKAGAAFRNPLDAEAAKVLTDRFLNNHRGVELEPQERLLLERSIAEVKSVPSRTTLVRIGDTLSQSTLLLEGLLCRSMDDHNGHRQMVAIHIPGDFVDLHGYPLKTLDHEVATLTAATIATVPHSALDRIVEEAPSLTRKLWYATLLDAAVHRAWLLRLGRLDGVGRVAHFLCEINARLKSAKLSDGRRFALDITQSDLADICGLTTVHINRVLRILREEKLCVFRASLVEVLDPAGLAARAEFDSDYLYLRDP
jgi:CRP-like cAMP-binding protein